MSACDEHSTIKWAYVPRRAQVSRQGEARHNWAVYRKLLAMCARFTVHPLRAIFRHCCVYLKTSEIDKTQKA